MAYQMALIRGEPKFPPTRFQGSKYKLTDWIWESIEKLDFQTALDAFGGTGCVSHMLKRKGKTVTYNDSLKFNWYIGLALIENDAIKLTRDDIDFLLEKRNDVDYPRFISDTFKNIYYTDEENAWIDRVVTNIESLDDQFKKAIAYFALFQSCIIKRPFNLFHRKNLYIRLSDVERSFGNNTTWDKPFEDYFCKFAEEANEAVFSNGKRNRALNGDVFDIQGRFDLVYFDTPYISRKGIGVDYLDFYHFLEGLAHYSSWGSKIDYRTKHRRLMERASVWTDKNQIKSAFNGLFSKFRDSVLVVSYRSDGIPTIEELKSLLLKYKPNVEEYRQTEYKYVLSSSSSEEVLLVGR